MAWNIGEIVQLVVTIAVPVIPIGVRLFFIRKASKALDKLRSSIDKKPSSSLSVGIGPDETVTSFPKSADQGCVSQGEPGFRELESAVRGRGLLSGDVESFCLAAGKIPEITGAMNLRIPDGPAATVNAVFYAVYATGETERLIYHPTDFYQTADLTDVNQWVRYAANSRSESITIALALLLFAILF